MVNSNLSTLCFQYLLVGILVNEIALTVLGLLFYVILLCSKYYWLVLVYLFWCWLDYRTCETGTRRSIWFRNWWVWKHCTDYFPTKLIKTVDLDPNKNYIFAAFPHGIIPFGLSYNFGTDVTNFKELFPGLVSHMSMTSTLFFIPIIREIAIAIGACVPTERAIANKLSNDDGGRVVVILPGGTKEASITKRGRYKINFRNRKGFIRLALKYGSVLVPVISFGDNETYDNFLDPDSPIAEWIYEKIGRPLRLCFNFPRGKCFWLPYRTPITTVVGSPIFVKKISEHTEDDISKVQEQFMKALIEMFEREKYKYLEDPDNKKLEII